MTGLRFVDTNVLVYAAAARTDAPAKYERARDILAEEELCSSAQVLQEFFVAITRKPRVPLSAEAALRWIDRLCAFPCADIDSRLVKAAIVLSERYRIAYWDAAIIAAAERLSAEVVYSEDLNHGQTYGSVRVENPFRAVAP